MTWWLAIPSPRANTPNWDIASECLIGGRPGLLLLEAKAHDMELHRERSRKRLSPSASDNSVKNHKGIAACIESANVALTHETGLKWSLSRDHHYQMSNRFAWSWKLAEIGVPVILVYLAFLDAAEMGTNGPPWPAMTSGLGWSPATANRYSRARYGITVRPSTGNRLFL